MSVVRVVVYKAHKQKGTTNVDIWRGPLKTYDQEHKCTLLCHSIGNVQLKTKNYTWVSWCRQSTCGRWVGEDGEGADMLRSVPSSSGEECSLWTREKQQFIFLSTATYQHKYRHNAGRHLQGKHSTDSQSQNSDSVIWSLAAEKTSRWLCIKRADPWTNTARTQAEAWSTSAGSPGGGCLMFRKSRNSQWNQEHRWWCALASHQ